MTMMIQHFTQQPHTVTLTPGICLVGRKQGLLASQDILALPCVLLDILKVTLL